MLNGLDLFSGIGGISLALSEWIRSVAYCEIDTYCQAVLLSRMGSKELIRAPIWDDVRTLTGSQFPIGAIDIIYGGFPCQDISVAGHGKGLEGERSGLFFEIVRLAKEIKPKFIFLENVPAIRSRGGLRILREIAELGYDTRFCVISAASIGALHRRERWFMLAYAKHLGFFATTLPGSNEQNVPNTPQRKESSLQSEGVDSSRDVATQASANSNGNDFGQQLFSQQYQQETIPKSDGLKEFLADSSGEKCSRLSIRTSKGFTPIGIGGQYGSVSEWQEAVSSICRVTDGVPYRVDRIKALGNSVVPEQAKEAFEILMGLK